MAGGLSPKIKRSRSRTRHRRAQWKAAPVVTVPCEHCQEQKLPHRACASCGRYRGRMYPEAIRES